ncbi:MAG: YdeI/OmpD-associated family protein [Terriglobia bacterium]
MTWPESVDAALCFGWIDGVRKRIDDISYTIRFTPRKPRSIWSAVNIGRVAELREQGLMSPAGLRAFECREEFRSRVYSFEQERIEFENEQLTLFEANEAGWEFFQAQPASYRRAATWWVVNAKRAETKTTRLAKLIAVSAQSLRLEQFTSRKPDK